VTSSILPSLLILTGISVFLLIFIFSSVRKKSVSNTDELLKLESQLNSKYEKKIQILQNEVIALTEKNAKLNSLQFNLDLDYKNFKKISEQQTHELEQKLNSVSAEKSKIISQKKSSEVRLGHIAETLAPFLDQFDFDPEHCTFLGKPIDYISFGDSEITFIEVKSGKSQLNIKQRKIRDQIKNNKVSWKEVRII